MSVNLVQFPLTVSQWNKTVVYSTDVIVGRNGQEVRNAMWQDPLLKFNAAFAIRNYADINTLATFFHAMKGREQSFLVKDWSDFAVDTFTTFAETPNGVLANFQLIKKYTQTIGVGSSTYIRTIKYPKSLSLTVRVNGTTKVEGTHYNYSTSTGIVTFTGGNIPTTGQTVDFKIAEYYVPCRFDTDELPIEMLNYWVASGADKSNVQVPDIPMIEVRVS